MYLAGSVLHADGGATYAWGSYRSDDVAAWLSGAAVVFGSDLDDPQHQFGYINCLAGDPRQPGRVYLGTGGRGIVYGDPQTATATPTGTPPTGTQ